MKIDLKQFSGECVCGKTHKMDIKKILLERGALSRLPEVAKELGLTGKPCIICDDNTYKAAAEKIEKLIGDCDVIKLDPNGLHPDERIVEMIEAEFKNNPYIIAVGGGVLTDTGKYIGFKHGGIPVIVVPTCASVDGFAANSSIMTFNNFKHPLTTQAAIAIVADTDVLEAAPYRMTASGLGDLLGKYTALADWKFGEAVGGIPLCPRIYQMVVDAVDRAMSLLDQIAAQDGEAIESLMYALILAGLTIQMWGDSRPASGCEHHLSHLWELNIVNESHTGFHGEMVGVGMLLCVQLIEKLFAKIGDKPEAFIKKYEINHKLLQEKYGSVYEELMKYNRPDESEAVTPEIMVSEWQNIKKMYTEILPSYKELCEIYARCGMKRTMEDVGVETDLLPVSLKIGPYVRGRLTLYRMFVSMMDMEISLEQAQ